MAVIDKNITPAEVAALGEGHLAYLREISSDEIAARFPGMPPITPGLRLWGLFGASGQPILLTDERAEALASAMQNELIPVSLH